MYIPLGLCLISMKDNSTSSDSKQFQTHTCPLVINPEGALVVFSCDMLDTYLSMADLGTQASALPLECRCAL